jgi:hypothetical protein
MHEQVATREDQLGQEAIDKSVLRQSAELASSLCLFIKTKTTPSIFYLPVSNQLCSVCSAASVLGFELSWG